MLKIKNIWSNKFLNSRAQWTVGTYVELTNGSVGFHTVADGASTGEDEAVSINCDKAVTVVNSIFNTALKGRNALNQEEIDHIMIDLDKTENKRKLGGNSITSVSLALAKAAAMSQDLELYEYIAHLFGNEDLLIKHKIKFPTPLFNVLNGGKHAQNNLSVQEFLIIPSAKKSFVNQVQVGLDVYNNLKLLLKTKNFATGVGDEGGFAPTGFTIEKALSLIKLAASKNYVCGKDVFFGMDVAANSFRKGEKYFIAEQELLLSGSDLIKFYKHLMKKFELIYIEDPFYEKHPNYWLEMSKQVSNKLLLTGDDLVVTNPSILQVVIKNNLVNSVIVKPNQVGTLTETLEFITLAKNANYNIVVSHRSGDTAEDTFISDLALGVGADFIKSGAPCRGERTSKYNRLLQVFYNFN